VKWVTRRRIKVNRAATAWLVRRFIDQQAEFVFVDPEKVAEVQVQQGALGFDAPGARYPHKDDKGRCSFEMLVDEHRPQDETLKEMAKIVHAADFDESGLAPEAAGLVAISQGFPLVSKDDHDTVEKSGFLYDALYESLRLRRGAKHSA
jgi:hypothetical protein